MKKVICVSLICATVIMTKGSEIDLCYQRLWGSGELLALDVQGHLAISVGLDRGVELYDISDPNQPVFLSVAHLTGSMNAYLDGRLLYALDSSEGVVIFDISDPTKPRKLNEPIPLQSLQHASWENDFLFVTSQLGGLNILDISDPTEPRLLGGVQRLYLDEMLPSWPYIYISNSVFEEMVVVDASDPTRPYVITSLNLDLGLRKMLMKDNHIFALEPSLTIFELTDPQVPHRLYDYHIQGLFRDMAAAGSIFYLSEDGGIRVYEINLLSKPRHLGDVALAGEFIRLKVEGGRLYAWPRDHGSLTTYDLGNPHSPLKIGSFDQFGKVVDLAVSGETAYVAHLEGGFRILDISDRHHVIQLAQISDGSRTLGVRVKDDLAYVTGRGLKIYDVSNPSQPSEVGSLELPASKIELRGRHLFLTRNNGFFIVDVSDPVNPFLVSETILDGRVEDIEVRGDLVYLTRSVLGVSVFDVVDPANPILKYTVDTPGVAGGFHVGEDLTIVADHSNLLLMDTRNDLNLLGSVPTRFRSVTVHVQKDRVFVGGWFDGLDMFDVSDPFHPVLVGSTPFPGWVSSMVSGEDGQLFIGNRSYGFLSRGTIRDAALPKAYPLWNNTHGDLMCSAPARDIRAFITLANDGGFCPCPF